MNHIFTRDAQQPVATAQKLSAISSPHFENQQKVPLGKKGHRLVDKLQSASDTPDPCADGPRNLTIITGRDGANPSLALSADFVSARRHRNAIDQSRAPIEGQPQRPSCAAPVSRPSRKTDKHLEMARETMPRLKHSEAHGLGDRWKVPLIYPRTGKRRETVQYEDLFRLDEDEFLNDNLIGFFLRYLEHHLEQTKPGLASKVYFYNSYFFERLVRTSKKRNGINYESVQKWTRNIDIFSRDYVVVPVNESLHWYVAIICNLPRLIAVESDEEDDLAVSTASIKAAGLLSGQEKSCRTNLAMQQAQEQPTEKPPSHSPTFH